MVKNTPNFSSAADDVKAEHQREENQNHGGAASNVAIYCRRHFCRILRGIHAYVKRVGLR